MEERPGWNEYFMNIVDAVARRSTCLRRQLGALVVKDRRVLATGYNGAPSGLPHCSQTGCRRKQEDVPSGERYELCRGVHAEENALLQAAKHGVSTEGAVLYTSLSPCISCTKSAINAGISKVIASKIFRDKLASEIMSDSDLKLIVLNQAE